MVIPESLRYSKEHEWIHLAGNQARVGITDYAQGALGDVVYVELPSPGDSVALGDAIGEVESTKSVSDVFAPVSGTVAAVNDALEESPGKLNEDPYGDGWLFVLELSDVAQVDRLLTADEYQALTDQ